MGRYSTALLVTKVVNQWLNRIDFKNMIRYAIFPDFPGIPDFHKSKSSIKKPMISIKSWKDLARYCCFNSEVIVSALS